MIITSTYKKHSKENKVAVVFGDKQISYYEWNKFINKSANYFNNLKSKGKVVILLKNSITFLQAFTGSAHAGWIAIPFDTKWKYEEIKEKIMYINPDLIICDEKFIGEIKEFSTKLITKEEFEEDSFLQCEVFYGNTNESDLFYMGFTSGTTGKPKAFIRNHLSWIESFNCSIDDFKITKEQNVLIIGNLVHSLFLYAAISTLFIGGTIVLLEKFSPIKTYELMGKNTNTVLFAVPTMLEALVRETVSYSFNQPLKIISSGAKWEYGLKERIRDIFYKSEFYEFYGASELSFVTYLDPIGNIMRPESIGKPFSNVEVSIRNNEKEVKKGEIGKLYVKSDLIFSGYYENEEDTKEVLKGGWVTVGDLVRQAKDGYIYLVGRDNNKIVVGGVNVYPEEIESVLLQNEDVIEACVIGIKDEYWGEKLVAFVKVKDNDKFSLINLKKYIRNRLSSYKIPTKWHVLNEFPYTYSGKIAREVLRENYIKENLK